MTTPNNKQARHTPGPWLLNSHDDIEMGEAGPLFSIADVSPPSASYEEGKANGYLIAAAPELLDGCKFLIGAMEDGDLVRDTSKDHRPDWALKAMAFVSNLAKVASAIAKAEGRAS